ncbi:MAG TPA: EamA family transporter [Candidatus Acidoferrales bacterium]|nr:EamA family transporter [Candidatus Acidoferrales bacterium]
MPIFLGLTAAICWGVADFCARFGSQRIGAFRTLFYMQIVGLVLMTVYLEPHGGLMPLTHGWRPWAFAAIAGVLSTVGSLALYHAFRIGVMSVVAPISSSYPAITVVLAFVSGERLPVHRVAGLVVIIIGVILAATSFAALTAKAGPTDSAPHAQLSRGVGWSIFAAIAFGIMFWFIGFHVVPLTGAAFSVWMIRLSTIGTLALLVLPARQTLKLPSGSVWWFVAAIGVTDTTAYFANNAGLGTGHVSVVSVLASLYGAVTVLLSWIFLRERLERSQWVGIALIFIGIISVSI